MILDEYIYLGFSCYRSRILGAGKSLSGFLDVRFSLAPTVFLVGVRGLLTTIFSDEQKKGF